MIIQFNEGLWSLGKSRDTENTVGFVYDRTKSSQLGELRYIRPQVFLEICSVIKDRENFATCDRTPYFMRVLAENNLASENAPFLGVKNAYTNLEDVITQMKWLENSFENTITRVSLDNDLVFNIYVPSDYDNYYKNFILIQNDAWYAEKYLRTNCLTVEILKKITNDLLKTFLDLRNFCNKDRKPEINLKISKVW